MAISNVPRFTATVEGPFGVGARGIFATIVRVVQAFVCVWEIILIKNYLFWLNKQVVNIASSMVELYSLRLKHIPFLALISEHDISHLSLTRIVLNLIKPKNLTCTIIVSISCMQFYLEREIKLYWFFSGIIVDGRIIGSLSSDVFKRRTSTGSEPFSILNCLDATKFALLRVFTLKETICANFCLKSRLRSTKVVTSVWRTSLKNVAA